jgi:hypothetical protein
MVAILKVPLNNRKYYRVYKWPPLVFDQMQIRPVCTLLFCIFIVHFNIFN